MACAEYIKIKNLGLTGFETISEEFTSVRNVYLNLSYTTGATACRYTNYHTNTQIPSQDYAGWTYQEPCVSSRIWELTEGAGQKYVFYQINYSTYNKTFNDSIYYNSSGVGLDLTPPTTPLISLSSFSNNNRSISVSWSNATDPESSVLKIPLSYRLVIYLSIGSIIADITTQEDSYDAPADLPHGAIIYANVSAINSAELKSNASTYPSGLTIDLENPYMLWLRGSFLNGSDGKNHSLPEPPVWINANLVNFSWLGYDDITTDTDAYSYLLTNDPSAEPDNIPEGNIGALQSETRARFASPGSGKYYFKVKARDKAGNWGQPLSFEFWIDITNPPAPVILRQNSSGYSTTFYWSEPIDPESGIAKYNITLYAGGLPEHSAILEGEKNTSHTFTGLSSIQYNTTVRAMNWAGLWSSEGRETSSADFDPPSIIAMPNSTSIWPYPEIKAYTDENAICYYNGTKFLFTNSTYHSARPGYLPDGSYTYSIVCYDMSQNQGTSPLNLWVDSTIVSETVSIPAEVRAYAGTMAEFIAYSQNGEDRISGLSLDYARLLIDKKDTVFSVFDYGDGSYYISFLAPGNPGSYELLLLLGQRESFSSLIIEPVTLGMAYYDGSFYSPTGTQRISFISPPGGKIGAATDEREINLEESPVEPGKITLTGISLNRSIYIFNTRGQADIINKENVLKEERLLDSVMPTFGYASGEISTIRLSLSPKAYYIINQGPEEIKKGRYNYLLVSSISDTGKKEVILLRN